jgi:hypothetical protein
VNDRQLKTLQAHVECLGYEVTPQPDGWTLASHPVRLNFLFRPFEIGVRLHCAIWLGKKRPDEDAWHAFLNRANDTSFFARFAMARDDDGEYSVRVRALLPGMYDRRTFGLLLDAWQEDVALLRGAPRSASEEEEAEEGQEAETPAALVN